MENPLGEAIRTIIITELPIRHKNGDTWTEGTTWQINLIEGKYYRTAYCHNQKDLVEFLSNLVNYPKTEKEWLFTDKVSKNILQRVADKLPPQEPMDAPTDTGRDFERTLEDERTRDRGGAEVWII